jgi:hypothetical protein
VVGFEQGIAVIGITAEHLWQQKRPVPDSGFFELEK